MTHIIAKNLTVYYPVVNATQKDMARVKMVKNDGAWGLITKGSKPRILAVDDFSISLVAGDSVALIGKNGSGKSTLLRTLGGIITANSGTLDVQGRAAGIFNLKQGLRMECTGRRNILLRGLALGKRRSEILEMQEQIEEFSELGDYLDLPMSTYSSGMIMRLVFAVVMAFEPDIMLLDEWIGTADSAFQEKVVDRLKRFTKEGKIFMLASHSASILKNTCNKALYMESGKVVEFGPLADVLATYKTSNKRAA